MSSCPESAPPPFTCPSQDDVTVALLALLPRGRAWPANDGGGTYARFKAWLASLAGRIPAAAEWAAPANAGFVQCAYFAAFGEVLAYVIAQFCALKAEFFCATASQTLDQWNAEYGLPDPCDPRADLCTRVASLAGSTLAFLTALAARAGWAVSLQDYEAGGTLAGCTLAGHALANDGIAATVIRVTVLSAESPAFQAVAGAPPLAGLLMAGQELNCIASIASLECLLARVAQAHLTLQYIVD